MDPVDLTGQLSMPRQEIANLLKTLNDDQLRYLSYRLSPELAEIVEEILCEIRGTTKEDMRCNAVKACIHDIIKQSQTPPRGRKIWSIKP